MVINFIKMQAIGNDYIYIDTAKNNREFVLKNASKLSQILSKRRFSVGGDGLVIIDYNKSNFQMIIYNSDGSRAKICGNALRCVAYYLSKLFGLKNIDILTDSGVKNCEVCKNKVSVVMGAPKKIDVDINTIYDTNICAYLQQIGGYEFISIGNNHLVLISNNFGDNRLIAPLLSSPKAIFDGINVEFCTLKDRVEVEVFERGSGFTLGCGSGSVAVYYALTNSKIIKKEPRTIYFKGGKLYLKYLDDNIILTGDANIVYSGIVKVNL